MENSFQIEDFEKDSIATLKSLYEDKQLVDVTLLSGREMDIQLHRSILVAIVTGLSGSIYF